MYFYILVHIHIYKYRNIDLIMIKKKMLSTLKSGRGQREEQEGRNYLIKL